MYKNLVTQSIRKPLFKKAEIGVDVLRLDLIHPLISGNKWFKLKYHLQEACEQGKKGIITFGGAYSNHLVATAVACKQHSLESIGIVRGDEHSVNDSINDMRAAGMQLIFVSRDEYRDKRALAEKLTPDDFYFVPEGGQSAAGLRGAEEILADISDAYSHIICSVGTATTMAGLINASTPGQHVVGICALKISGAQNELTAFLDTATDKRNYVLSYDYHFGGYAKHSPELISFMNALFTEDQIPSDFVYTGKMFFAVHDLVKNGFFKPNSKLLLIHSGGLQGNRSLPQGTLVF